MSRPNKGVAHVDAVEGPHEAKERLKAVLETIAGARTVEEACVDLGVSPARFDQLRAAALSGAVEALSPRPPGRPPTPPPDPSVLELRERVQELERENQRLRVREEVALRAPGLLEPREKKGPASERPRRPRA
jgi:transposase-like protein